VVQTSFSLFGEQRLAPAPMRPGFQRAALAKLLAHAPHRRDAEAGKLGDLRVLLPCS